MINLHKSPSQSGFTLVELIVSIVVIAVAVTGVLLAVQFTTMHSADPMIRQQAVAIADAYMEEILLQRYEDPDGDDNETRRSRFDDVYDYNDTNDKPPKDQTGNPLSGLENYRVSVQVTNSSNDPNIDFGPSGSTTAAQIKVTVENDAADVSFTLTGYKAKY